MDRRHKAFFERIIENHLENILAQQFLQAITKLYRLYLHREIENLEYVLGFYAGGLTHVLVQWMKDDNRVSAAGLMEALGHQLHLPYFD